MTSHTIAETTFAQINKANITPKSNSQESKNSQELN
jgi:hypothetical protein